MATPTKKPDDGAQGLGGQGGPAAPVPISLRKKPRRVKLSGGKEFTVKKTARGVEIEGLDIEGIGTAHDKAT